MSDYKYIWSVVSCIVHHLIMSHSWWRLD